MYRVMTGLTYDIGATVSLHSSYRDALAAVCSFMHQDGSDWEPRDGAIWWKHKHDEDGDSRWLRIDFINVQQEIVRLEKMIANMPNSEG